MLLELAVENYAVVDKLRVAFHPGLNLLTGETGSGKSILVGALDLLFGGRASADVIRSGEQRARVSGRFDVTGNQLLEAVIQELGFEIEDGELPIEREILANGKSRVYVAGRAATAGMLRQLAPFLGDIHGQHDQQQLYDPAAQRDMLDAFARDSEMLAAVWSAYRKWRAVEQELKALQGNEQDKLRQLDIWRFQQKEISAAALKPGEDVALDAERRVAQNTERLLETAGAAYQSLYEAPESAFAALRVAMRKLEDVGRIDSALEDIRATLDPAVIAVQEASYALRDYLDRLEADPDRLDAIETRLALIERLKRKYGGSLDAVLVFLADVERQIAGLENADQRLAELEYDQRLLTAAFSELSAQLSEIRKKAAAKLSKAVEAELAELAMERTVFRIEVTPGEWSELGADSVRFLVSPNRGEEPKPIERIASGGEISRVALALKSCLVASQPAGSGRTLVFDEVDTGIGGSAAEGVARRLKRLASSNQVLCVTHLAQVASFADHHFRVDKIEAGDRTTTRVAELSKSERRDEIARMISGQRVTPEALKHADRLIALANGV
ncbi:DNA repair protein RecN [Nevskia soli]|uniref:DNA repair protein RecN n=1 Tax=Nevskia soli TaxID=418856 RepID=UPI0015D92C7C|nr:DNA repair protein RecN [Nevskia soli]